MKRLNRRRFLTVAASTLAIMAASVAGAAPPNPSPIAGTYAGEATSSVVVDPMSPPEPVEITLTVEAGRGRKVAALLVTPEGEYQLTGTVSASGQLNLRHKQPGGPNLTLKGKFTPAVVDPPAPAMIEGTYKFTKGGDRGTFSVVEVL